MKGRDAFRELIEAYEVLAIECGRRSDRLARVMEERDELRAQLAAVTAERDDLQRRVASVTMMLPKLMPQTVADYDDEPSGDSGQLADLTKDPGEVAEPYQWQAGDEIQHKDRSIRTIERRTAYGALTLFERTGVYTQGGLESVGWKLHRKASEIKTAEPYQWQVGDEIECPGVTRRLVEDVTDGWVMLRGVVSPMSQPDWERRGWKLYRKASDIETDEPWRAWKVGTVICSQNSQHKIPINSDHSQTDKKWLWEQGWRTDDEIQPAEAEPWRAWKVGTVVTTGRALRRIDTRDTDVSLRTLWEQGYREQSSVGTDGEGQS